MKVKLGQVPLIFVIARDGEEMNEEQPAESPPPGA